MSTISNNDIAKAIYLASKDKSSTEMHQVHKKVVEFLTRKKFMSRVAVILEQLKKVINFENGIVSATVLSAHRVHEKEEKDLVHFLKNAQDFFLLFRELYEQIVQWQTQYHFQN